MDAKCLLHTWASTLQTNLINVQGFDRGIAGPLEYMSEISNSKTSDFRLLFLCGPFQFYPINFIPLEVR